jgi:hypothetical protein
VLADPGQRQAGDDEEYEVEDQPEGLQRRVGGSEFAKHGDDISGPEYGENHSS